MSPSALAKAPSFAAFSSNDKATSGGSDAFTILVDDDGNDNDDPGDHLRRVWRDLRIRVSEDLSIGGFDDIPLVSLVVPCLTTIRQPIQEIAEIAVRIVLERQQIDRSVTPKPALVERGSAAPPLS
ncbi:substrate-binding domain-containing protein [Rhizobium sp. 2YAF20]|uniref:substrate-binding domain-containing protein n=1 Tax=Rhizobium sp. 2YAF20 TaxID=3233027 RepID=UPI003F9471D2